MLTAIVHHNYALYALASILTFLALQAVGKFLWHIARDTLFLEKEYQICELLKKRKYKCEHMLQMDAYARDYCQYIPETFYMFDFIVNEKEETYEVPSHVYEKAMEGQLITVMYSTTRFSREIVIKGVHLISGTEPE